MASPNIVTLVVMIAVLTIYDLCVIGEIIGLCKISIGERILIKTHTREIFGCVKLTNM